MNYSEMLAAAKKVVADSLPDERKGEASNFVIEIQNLGGMTVESLAQLTEKDLRENHGLPMLVARQVLNIFQPNKAQQAVAAPIFVESAESAVLKLSPRELLEKFNPDTPSDIFGQRLRDLSQGCKFLVFEEDGNVNVEVSAQQLEELLEGYPEAALTEVEGLPKQLYFVGSRPVKAAAEHPLYPGVPLRPSGKSALNFNWGGFDLRTRQLIHVIWKDTKAENKNESILWDRLAGHTFEEIAALYPERTLIFFELERTGTLPALRTTLKRA